MFDWTYIYRSMQRPYGTELRSGGGRRPGLSVLTSLMVSVDVKLY